MHQHRVPARQGTEVARRGRGGVSGGMFAVAMMGLRCRVSGIRIDGKMEGEGISR